MHQGAGAVGEENATVFTKNFRSESFPFDETQSEHENTRLSHG